MWEDGAARQHRPTDEPSIFVGQHDGDGGLRIIDVEGAAGGDELDQLRAAVVVADVEGEGKPAAG